MDPIDRVRNKLDRPDLPRHEPWRWLGGNNQYVKVNGKTMKASRILWEHCRGRVLDRRRVVRIAGDPDDLNVYTNFTTFLAEARRDLLNQMEKDCVEYIKDEELTSWDAIANDPNGDLITGLSDESLELVLEAVGLAEENPRLPPNRV